jgi:hypothetical protein
MFGGNWSRNVKRQAIRKARLDRGDCLFCAIRKGENDKGNRDGKYVYPTGGFRPSKSKDRK